MSCGRSGGAGCGRSANSGSNSPPRRLSSSLLTVPLLLPYAAVQEQLQIARGRGELSVFAADVYSYFTAVREQLVWGDIARVYPKAEGDLFPGLVAVFLAVIGVVTWRRDALGDLHVIREHERHGCSSSPPWLHVIAAAATLLYRRLTLDLGLFQVRITNIDQLLLRALVLMTIAAIVSPGYRARFGEFMRARGFFVLSLFVAMWLSLGVSPQTLGRPLNLTGIYAVLYEYVPGFDGLRVPARFAMIVVLMLAVLGGYGAAAISRWRWATPALVVLTSAFLAESIVRPFPINGMGTLRDFASPEPRVYRPARAPAVYQRLARESGVVLAELPIGQSDYDIRAMFYSIVHHGKLLNGYSGFFPQHYGVLALTLSDVPGHPTIAWDALRDTGASHVIVHEGAWLDDRGPRTTAALTATRCHRTLPRSRGRPPARAVIANHRRMARHAPEPARLPGRGAERSSSSGSRIARCASSTVSRRRTRRSIGETSSICRRTTTWV